MEFSGKVHSITDSIKEVCIGKWDWSQFRVIYKVTGGGKGSGGKGYRYKRVQEDLAALNHAPFNIKKERCTITLN